jgi:hypothetical protein
MVGIISRNILVVCKYFMIIYTTVKLTVSIILFQGKYALYVPPRTYCLLMPHQFACASVGD